LSRRPSHFTLPLGVATFQSTYSQDTASVFAFTALSMLPALGFFLLAQRRIVNGPSGLSGSMTGLPGVTSSIQPRRFECARSQAFVSGLRECR
jgi:hypothetical protein